MLIWIRWKLVLMRIRHKYPDPTGSGFATLTANEFVEHFAGKVCTWIGVQSWCWALGTWRWRRVREPWPAPAAGPLPPAYLQLTAVRRFKKATKSTGAVASPSCRISRCRCHTRRIYTEEKAKGRRWFLGDQIASSPCHAGRVEEQAMLHTIRKLVLVKISLFF